MGLYVLEVNNPFPNLQTMIVNIFATYYNIEYKHGIMYTNQGNGLGLFAFPIIDTGAAKKGSDMATMDDATPPSV